MFKFFVALFVGFTVFSKPIAITIMGAYENQNVYRGAPIWSGPSAMIGPGFIFYDRLKLFGPSLVYSFFNREDSLSFDLGIRYFDDGKPLFPLDKTKESYRNSRASSLPLHLFYEYKFGEKNRFKFGMFLEKELKEYNGLFLKLNFSAPILPFISFVTEISVAEKSTNQYLYGTQASSGDGFISYGISNIIPFVPWNGRIINTLTKEVITQSSGRYANLVRGDYNNVSFSTRWFWDAL